MIDYTKYLKESELAIFLLHGVCNPEDNWYSVKNYTRKHIESDCFCEQMIALKECGIPISMDAVCDILINKERFPKNSFAITFDDGFSNNYYVAAAILDGLGIPATFYITTNFIEHDKVSWIDKIENCFEYATNGNIEFDDFKTSFTNTKEKIKSLTRIRTFAKTSKDLDVDWFANFVCNNVESYNCGPEKLDRKMTWDQIRYLNSNPLFTIGGHTHNHEIMSYLDKDDLRYTIEKSLKMLREKADVNTTHYSYPEGMENCFNESTIRELKRQGIKICPTAICGTNKNTADRFKLKRIPMI